MSVDIHSTAIVKKGAELGVNVKVGPFCIVGHSVKIDDGCLLRSHVNIVGRTSIGQDNEFYPFCSIGDRPQDLSYRDEDTRLEIGDKNIFREYVSVHRGAFKENQITSIGSENLLMSYTHLGHNVIMGNKNVIVNGVQIAGHVKIKNNVTIGGLTTISQFVTIGDVVYIRGASSIYRDVPPFCIGYGNTVRLKGINIIGLRRQGHSKKTISKLINFYQVMKDSTLAPRSFVENKDLMKEFSSNEQVEKMVAFIRGSHIGITQFMNSP